MTISFQGQSFSRNFAHVLVASLSPNVNQSSLLVAVFTEARVIPSTLRAGALFYLSGRQKNRVKFHNAINPLSAEPVLTALRSPIFRLRPPVGPFFSIYRHSRGMRFVLDDQAYVWGLNTWPLAASI